MMRKQIKIFILAIIIAHVLFFLLLVLPRYIGHDNPNGMSIDITQHADLLFPQLSYGENFAILWLIMIGLGFFLYWRVIESRKPDINYFKTNVKMKHTGFEASGPEPEPLYDIYSYIYLVLMLITLMIIFVLIVVLLSSFPYSTW